MRTPLVTLLIAAAACGGAQSQVPPPVEPVDWAPFGFFSTLHVPAVRSRGPAPRAALPCAALPCARLATW